MNKDATDLLERARRALRTAEDWVTEDPDAATSRAYYAAFYGVSALFAMEDRTFVKHSAVETAVHRDLVKTRRWVADLGKAYSELVVLRQTGDYGGGMHMDAKGAGEAVAKSRAILRAVEEVFSGSKNGNSAAPAGPF